MRDHINTSLLRKVSEVAKATGIKAYVVGGFVRDILLNRGNKDVDIVVIGEGPVFAEEVAGTLGEDAKLSIFKNFGTANIRYKDFELEFVGARKESYLQHSRKPIVESGTLEDDLSRRDFTINALAIGLNENDYGDIIDLFDGRGDLERKILKTPLEPGITFSDDPLRMMRGVRFASQLGFRLADETYQALMDNKERISIISPERIVDEFNKILLSPVPSKGLKILFNTGLLKLIFPELVALQGIQTIDNKSHKDNFFHTLQVVDNLARESGDLWHRWAALLHDIGKPPTQKFDAVNGWTFHGHEVVGSKMVPRIFKAMRLPMNEKMKYVQKLVFLHHRPIPLTQEVTDSAIRRLIVDAGEELDDLMQLCNADVTSKNPEKVNRYRKRFQDLMVKIREVEEKDKLRNWRPPITGETIMEAFNLPPGRIIGDIKDEIVEAILNGDIPNEFEDAYKYMLQVGKNKGYEPLGQKHFN